MKTKSILLGLFSLFLVSNVSAQQAQSLFVNDTRSINEAPFASPQIFKADFKRSDVVGIQGLGEYSGVLTFTPWSDGTAGPTYQFALNQGGFFYRQGYINQQWQNWQKIATEGTNTFTGNQNLKSSLYLTNAEGNISSVDERVELKYWGDKSNQEERHGFLVYPKQFWIHPVGKNNAEGIHFNKNAEVGIGTGAIAGYKLSVNGTIRAKEVRVETGWADFVFKKDYQLPTLQEVKAHIDEHQHLPGIPSEAEVKENGVGLAEITTKLLQKVEELTLYAIQQNEKLAEQQNINEELINRIKELESSKK